MSYAAERIPYSDEELSQIVFDGIEDDGQNGDFILVLGFRDVVEDRVPKAAELYKAGRAPKIIFSGAPVMPTRFGEISEAEHMAKTALELGVPEEDIIIDNIARTTDENMICGLLMMQRHKKLEDIHRVLIVTSCQHIKRAYHLARLFWPKHIEISCCPTDTLISRSSWIAGNNGKWRRLVLHEAELLAAMEENSFIPKPVN